jgi:hypothetical protein
LDAGEEDAVIHLEVSMAQVAFAYRAVLSLLPQIIYRADLDCMERAGMVSLMAEAWRTMLDMLEEGVLGIRWRRRCGAHIATHQDTFF